jgi:hypothetical protein
MCWNCGTERGGIPGAATAEDDPLEREAMFPGLDSLPVGPRSGSEFTRAADILLIIGQLLSLIGSAVCVLKAVNWALQDESQLSPLDGVVIPLAAGILLLVNLIVIARIRRL